MNMALDRPKARREASDSTITMRVPEQTRLMIDTAAAAVGKSRTEFVLESARRHAIDVLLDQRVFHLDEAASEAFAKALADPVEPGETLRALMRSKAPWE
jgi:uncharacterized protein (DUF1778 family)